MNSNVHPLVVALVLVFTGIAVATWMWAAGQAAGIDGPAQLKADPKGHVYLQIQNELIEHDAKGSYVITHDLTDLGVEILLGSFDFFSNGDILLRRGPDPRSTRDNIRAFALQSNLNTIEPQTADSGLFRCQLVSKACVSFGATPIDFKAAFGIHIDRETDEVYISDTTRHVLRKYSSDGIALSEPVAGFKFPNQLLLHEGQLLIADTNHQQIRIVDPSSASFGKDIDKISVTPSAATDSGRTWSTRFARVGKKWWVQNMRNGMKEGGIFVFDDEWQFERQLEMPEEADPIALIALGDVAWVSDWKNDKVYRFSVAGEPLAALNSRGLADIVTRLKAERRKFELMGYSGVVLLILILGGLALRAFALGPSATLPPVTVEVEESYPVLHMEPDDNMLRRMKLVHGVLMILMSLMTIAGFRFVSSIELALLEREILLPVLAILLIPPILIALITWINRTNTDTSIRVDGDRVTLRDYAGRKSSCTIANVRYNHLAIATKDAVVFLGQSGASVYDRKLLKQALFPRLSGVPKSSALEMQMILIQQRHPQGVMWASGVVVLVLWGLWLLLK